LPIRSGGKFFPLIPPILIGQWDKKIAGGMIFCWTKGGWRLKLRLLVWIGFQRFVCFIQKSSDLGINLIIGMFLCNKRDSLFINLSVVNLFQESS